MTEKTEERFDTAIDNSLAMIRTNCKPDEALKFSQAVLNLAHAKVQLEALKK